MIVCGRRARGESCERLYIHVGFFNAESRPIALGTYVAKGSGNTTGAYSMRANQSLIGAGATLTVGVLTVTGNSANTPTLSGTLTASGVTGLTVNGVSMSTGWSTAVDLTNSDGNFTFQSISTSSAPVGIRAIAGEAPKSKSKTAPTEYRVEKAADRGATRRITTISHC